MVYWLQEKLAVKPTEREHKHNTGRQIFYKTDAWFSGYNLLEIEEDVRSVCLELQRSMLACLKSDYLTGWTIPRVVRTKLN